MAKRALITGISGQDGAYLARLLLEKGYEVAGALRYTSTHNLGRLAELGIEGEIELLDLDLLEFSNILRLVEHARPDELYSLASQSFVGISFEQPIYIAEVDGLGVARLLEAVRTVNPKIRFYQASTSEMFGKVQETPQRETTPFYPRSPYGVAKLYAHWITVNYRESYGIHASSGIAFNHESPMRGQHFVTRRVTLGLAHVKHGKRETLELGNLDAQRDWGFAGDYVAAMWSMVQQDAGDDFVLATGVTRKVRDLVEQAGKPLGFDIEWAGAGLQERGIDRRTGRTVVTVTPKQFRPAEVDLLVGDATKLAERTGWRPHTTFTELMEMMAEADERRVIENRIMF